MNTRLYWDALCPGGESIHLAHVEFTADTRRPEHSHDFYECFLVESGHGRQRSAGSETPLTKGLLCFVRPEHTHALTGASRDPLRFINVAFKSSVVESLPFAFPEKLWQAGCGIQLTGLNSMQQQHFGQRVNELSMGGRSELDAAWFLLSLLRTLESSVSSMARSGVPDWLHEALPRAAEPGALREGLPRLVRLCGRSREHVNRSFRKYLHQTPSQWLNRERIHYARRLLETTRQPVIDIAYDCGYESLSYFHKIFKSETGLSPLKFRQRAIRVQMPGQGAV